MIAFLEGRLLTCESDTVVLVVNGIGFRLFVPPELTGRLPGVGETVQLYTYLAVKEDALELFGFGSEEERLAFTRLLGVSGIGPRTALAVVGRLGTKRLWQAIVQEDAAVLCAAPGVGKKTARRIILELKDHLAKEGEPKGGDGQSGIPSTVGDAVAALVALGYHTGEALDAVTMVSSNAGEASSMDATALIRMALQQLGKG